MKKKHEYHIVIQEQNKDSKWINNDFFEADNKFNIIDPKEQKRFDRLWKKLQKKDTFRLFKWKHEVPTLISREIIVPKDKIKAQNYKTEKLVFSNEDQVLMNLFNGMPIEIVTVSEGIIHEARMFVPNLHNIYLKENLKIGASVNRSLLIKHSPAKKVKK
jgi:hypothetical protein